ncbi:MAG: aldo/keto reductase [Pseudomonadota bacterium]|uniref:aldo/keto reductase n=1 Tax=Roseovarius TaxID=74030 RepID=UPI0022A8822A|nr:aldo/keto reductase [Roseovarius sp. EGI FJ00037]MCZ0814045.1 aldo/keto reductase [Roseovarius sp. EGI FJ00037]
MKNMITSPDGTAASRFAFGTMQFGGPADEGQSRAMFDTCIEAGLNHFDTAYVYTDGEAETLLGRFAAPLRERLIIATKAGYRGGAGRDNLRAQFDLSRRRLGMDHVDILYLHRFDPDTDLNETMQTFATLREEGKIAHMGLSNFAAWQVMKAACIAARFDLPVSILQPMYNLVKRQAEVEILPMCQSEGIAVAPYSPLAGGLLTGKYAAGGTGRLTENDRYAARYGQDWMHAAAKGLGDIATELGVSPATLAAAWAAHHPARPMPILSARSTAQLQPSLDAIGFAMDEALHARLSALSPAPPPATDRLEEA